MRFLSPVLILIFFISISPLPLRACDVPVFRYALERWLPDEYVVLVLHNAPLTGEQSKAIKLLRDAAGSSGKRANIRVETVDISKGAPPEYRSLAESLDEKTVPCLALRFPQSVHSESVLWSRPLNVENARMLLDSPLRGQIAERIVAGDAGVWIFRESGDRARDNAAADTLRAALSSWKYRYLPPSERERALTANSSAGRETSFSLVRLPRGDDGDPILDMLLLRVEPDLGEYAGEPMAFPVYGRGRALYAFVGDGITRANVHKACRFMTGDCSCEVKALNPGLDLVMTADWERGVGESWIPPEEAPSLTGLPVIPDAKGTADSLLQGRKSASTSVSPRPSAAEMKGKQTGDSLRSDADSDSLQAAGLTGFSNPLARNIGIAIFLVILIAAALAVRLGTTGKKP